MSKQITLSDALRCAIDTAREQPREVPALPSGWLDKAQLALDTSDTAQVDVLAREIASAHSQYPAEFDRKGWLYDLREVLLAIRLAQRASAAPSSSVDNS